MTRIDPNGVPTRAEAVRRDSPAEWARVESRHAWLLLAVVGLLGALLVGAGVVAVDHGWLPLPLGGGR
ncbi:hypothetical protein GCM10011608_09170 [Micromonospora sonchi]|uniref:Uncharacterized protein n=1 Tax=Micromonospora sonchi TaxID=1763543 RepID=A0A917TKH6_9ACTN|nr:hypothetical protein [Micromonospora sonchi]GGM26555.1 hypothetical protein GCM10011608_09170 [Micromonospora sonchi]